MTREEDVDRLYRLLDRLGRHSPGEHIRRAGLWNVDHVTASYVPACLDVPETHVGRTTPL